MTKRGQKGEGRWVVIVSLGFHRVRCLGGGSTETPMCGMQSKWSSICTKLADNVGDHVVLSPVGAVLVLSPGT